MPESNQTEKATPRRRRKAREQGQVARSRELPNLVALVGSTSMIVFLSSDMAAHWRSFYVNLLSAAAGNNLTPSSPIFFWSALEILRWTVPVLLVAAVLSLAAGLAQGGINFAPSALGLKFERLNPASRLGQVFSLTSLGNLGKSLIPFAAIGLLGFTTLREHWSEIVRSSEMNTIAVGSLAGGLAFAVAWKSGLVLLAWSGIDYGLIWRQSENQLRMSREELKQEHKETDGNPHTKQQVRKVQRAMRKRRSLQATASATMVVTNPTHYAVALKYEAGMLAPEVVAKGRDLLAQKIKQIAFESGVTVLENKPLARALYQSVEVGDSIPGQLYQAVAEVLVVVFRAREELREQERQRRARNAAGEVI